MPLEDLPQPIKDYILSQANNNDDYEPMPNTYSITEILGGLRKLYFKRKYGNRPVSLKTANNFYRGNMWDRNFTSLFKRNQIRCTHRCSKIPVCISGKFDFLDIDEGFHWVTDLKSPANLYYVKREGQPSSHYQMQVQFYSWCNAQTHGRVMYWDGSDCLKFPVDVSDATCLATIEYVEGRATIIWVSEKNGKAPPKSTCESWECPECQYTKECELEGQTRL